MDGVHGLGRMVYSCPAIGKLGREYPVVVGAGKMASAMGLFLGIFPGTVFLWVETDAFGAARRALPEHLPDCHREGFFGEGLGVLYAGAPVFGIPLFQPDRHPAAGDLSGAVQDTGRRREAGRRLPPFPAGICFPDIPVAGGVVCRGRTVGIVTVERAVAFCGNFAANPLLFDDVVPDTFDQLEPVTGKGAVGLVPEVGDYQENNRGGDFVCHAAFRAGGDVLGANTFFHFVLDYKYILYREIDPGRFCPANERPFPGAGVVVGHVAGGDRRANAGGTGRLETGDRHCDRSSVLCRSGVAIEIP